MKHQSPTLFLVNRRMVNGEMRAPSFVSQSYKHNYVMLHVWCCLLTFNPLYCVSPAVPAGVTVVETESGSHGGPVTEDWRGERGEDHAV